MFNQRLARYPVIHLAGMGKALQHAADLLAILPKNYNIFGVDNSALWEFVKNKFLKNTLISDSMDTRLDQINQESVRTTILRHEEIFKEQVHELHRLYKVQKMLMAELRYNSPKLHSTTTSSSQTTRIGGKCIDVDNRTGFWTGATTSETNQTPFSSWNHNCSNLPNLGYNFHPLFSISADPSLRDQNSSCSRDTSKMPKGFDLEQQVEEISTDISAIVDQAERNCLKSPKDTMNINSSSGPCFYNEGESEVELTLSIGFGTSKKKSKNRKPHRSRELGCSSSNSYERRHLDPSLSIRSDRGEECTEPTNRIGSASASATCDRENMQQPPWLFQALSLNRT